MIAKDIVQLARNHVTNNPETEASARICLADAVGCLDDGNLAGARRRAIKSLAYSVGVDHADYRRAES